SGDWRSKPATSSTAPMPRPGAPNPSWTPPTGARVRSRLFLCRAEGRMSGREASWDPPFPPCENVPTMHEHPCPLCHGPMEVWYRLPQIWHQPRGTRSFSTYWCARCGFGSLFPRPSIEELRSYYDTDTYFERYAGESQEQYQGQIASVPAPSFLDRVRLHLAWRLDRSQGLDPRMIAETIGTSPARICEIGCGNGDLLVALKALGHHVVGVEPSENARRRATASGLDVVAGYAEDLPEEVKGRSIGGVIMSMVLDSCSDP